MKDDLEKLRLELRLVLHWRKLCQNREKWGKSIKPVKRKATKGEIVAGRETKAEPRSQRLESFGQTKGEEWSECPGGHQGVGCLGGGCY